MPIPSSSSPCPSSSSIPPKGAYAPCTILEAGWAAWEGLGDSHPWHFLGHLWKSVSLQPQLPVQDMKLESAADSQLEFAIATERDFEEILAISKGIYGGLDYLPSRYHAWIHEPNRTVVLAKKNGVVVRARAKLGWLAGMLFPTPSQVELKPGSKTLCHRWG